MSWKSQGSLFKFTTKASALLLAAEKGLPMGSPTEADPARTTLPSPLQTNLIPSVTIITENDEANKKTLTSQNISSSSNVSPNPKLRESSTNHLNPLLSSSYSVNGTPRKILHTVSVVKKKNFSGKKKKNFFQRQMQESMVQIAKFHVPLNPEIFEDGKATIR
jgi:hypothetical protein